MKVRRYLASCARRERARYSIGFDGPGRATAAAIQQRDARSGRTSTVLFVCTSVISDRFVLLVPIQICMGTW